MTLEIPLPHPERFWRAAAADIGLMQDPDVEDGKQRWCDRDRIDWARIAALVDDAGARIARRELDVDEDGDQVLVVDDDGLSREERNIVWSWLTTGEPPSSDPGGEGVGNGRHRLWNAWKHAPQAVLPVYSDALQYVDSIAEMPQLAALTTEAARGILLNASRGVMDRSPMYSAELTRWANASETR